MTPHDENKVPATTLGIVAGLLIAYAIVALAGCAMSTLPECPELAPTCPVEFAEIDVACFAAGTANRLARERSVELGCAACLPLLYPGDLESRRPIDGLAAWDVYRRLLDAETCDALTDNGGAFR